MVFSLLAKLKKIKSNWQPSYLRYGCLPIAQKTVLLEGGQGANVNGNMFALAKELSTDPRYVGYKVYFTVTNATRAKARDRFIKYGCRNVQLVVRHSRAYCKALATAEFLLNDNTFPPYFHKREGQVYCNTWHGTPLKTLGLSNKETLLSVNNVQKNFLACDYALFPNEFTRKVFMKDYDLEGIFKGESIIANYPRNGVFYNPLAGQRVKQALGFEGKRLFAYMPTFRDAANPKAQLEQITAYLKEWDDLLDDTSHLLVNLHFVLARELRCEEFRHISCFPGEYETYDVLNACDGLVTDYSSVFFDFAVTGKPIVLFAYDREEYFQNRGVYFSLNYLPFPCAETVEQVMEGLNSPRKIPEKFIEGFCPGEGQNSARQLLDTLLIHSASPLKQEEEMPVCLVFCGSLPKGHFQGLQYLIARDVNSRFVLAYRGKVSSRLLELRERFAPRVTLLGLTSAFQITPRQGLLLALQTCGIKVDLQEFYQKEADRLFGGILPQRVVDFSCHHGIAAGILNALPGEKYYAVHSKYLPALGKRGVQQQEEQWGFSPISLEKAQEEFLAKSPEALEELAGERSCFSPILPLYFNFRKRMICFSLFRFTAPAPLSVKEVTWKVGEQPLSFWCAGGKKKKKKHFGFCRFSLPLETALSLPAKNEVTVSYSHPLGGTVSFAPGFCTLPRNMFLGLRSPMGINRKTKTCAIFRQSLENKLTLYVRPLNPTDRIWERLKQTLAFLISLFWHTEKTRSLVLLFEKNGEKYEESASVLYEELLKAGHKNAYFILTRDSSYLPRVAEQYKSHLLYKYSFRHYLYFFKAKTFIGTEGVVHAVDLQTYNLLALRKVGSKNMNYVFLQHGVMYMVSLNSESRGMFGRKTLKGKYRVVVSSREEANHFTALGGHLPEDLYITGLPKFDRNTYSPTADKIVIMPTWRPWEIHEAHGNFLETGYCKMIAESYAALPPALQQKAVILPHPLVSRQLEELPPSLTKKMERSRPYDEILRETAVLITDYSSIAYDAFYRGARVIFDWSQKDACMKAYGPSTKLMLDEHNVFGDVVYRTGELARVIEENYNSPQREEYQKRYSRLVEFHDGNNTARLMELLKKDGLI